MSKLLTKRMNELLGGYPSWANDAITKKKIDLIGIRLFELGQQYQSGMIDARRVNTITPLFILELLYALEEEHPITLRPLIEHYHVTTEFIKTLQLANKLRKGLNVRNELFLTARNINLSQRGNGSSERKNTKTKRLAIINEANKLKRKTPKLNTSKIALYLIEKYPEYKEGSLRNLLSPLKK